ncbi:MAG: AAA family ATPase [Gemmataceae bacterium]
MTNQPPNNSASEVVTRCELRPTDLDLGIDSITLGFQSTEDVEPLDHVVGQERAVRALEFGLAMPSHGYHVFVSGVPGTGKKTLVHNLLNKHAEQLTTPSDWVYLHNFDEPDSPLAVSLPSGDGMAFMKALEELLARVREDLPKALRAQDFDAERERLQRTFAQKSEALFQQLVERGEQLRLGVRRLPNGVLGFVPLHDGRPMETEEIEKLSDEDKEEIAKNQGQLSEYATQMMGKQQELSREMRGEIESIVQQFARRLLDPLIVQTKERFPQPELADWLDRVSEHMLANLDRFQHESAPTPNDLPTALRMAAEHPDPFVEYRVNVVVDNSRTQGAPVILEISPTYKNLFGTIERQVTLMGNVTADFTGIKPGSLLRANGGFLLLDLGDAITEPFVWKQLKRTLKSAELLTDAYEPMGLFSTLALKPQPIPITTKVVVVGSPHLYYLLQFLDEDFSDLFKVHVDFGPEADFSETTQEGYARFLAKLVQTDGLNPFDATAVVEFLRFGMREVAHRKKLSLAFGNLIDLAREASYWAKKQDAKIVTSEHVQQTLAERIYRNDRIAAKIRELIDEGTLNISVTGKHVGQINGLAVLDLGDFRFGRPSRVSTAAGIGREGVINIERESDMSGNTHNKGVLILQGYLRHRYARAHPIALSASIAFEQSYGWIEGDSASSAELYCLLSAIAEIPLRQDIAVTGSVDQFGHVQAVGGVAEKIEGFFDVCQLKGLTGSQGVCIPRSIVHTVVLRHDVLEAIREGQFHVWAIETIDEGIELLTGMSAGGIDQEATFHHRVDQRLQRMLAVLKEQAAPDAGPRIQISSGPPDKPPLPPLPGGD